MKLKDFGLSKQAIKIQLKGDTNIVNLSYVRL